MNNYVKDNIRVIDSCDKITFSYNNSGELINDYLEFNGFYHYEKDVYTKDNLAEIYQVLNDYKKQNISNINYATDIASNWLIAYLMMPTLKQESLLKTLGRIFISWRSVYKFNNSNVVIEELERQLKSRIKTSLIYNDDIVIESNNESVLDESISVSNYIGSLNDNIRMSISKNKVLLWKDNECTTLYYNYDKTKKK